MTSLDLLTPPRRIRMLDQYQCVGLLSSMRLRSPFDGGEAVQQAVRLFAIGIGFEGVVAIDVRFHQDRAAPFGQVRLDIDAGLFRLSVGREGVAGGTVDIADRVLAEIVLS